MHDDGLIARQRRFHHQPTPGTAEFGEIEKADVALKRQKLLSTPAFGREESSGEHVGWHLARCSQEPFNQMVATFRKMWPPEVFAVFKAVPWDTRGHGTFDPQVFTQTPDGIATATSDGGHDSS
eukprot:1935990-Lingulodinium_polyedra.AAC.1